MPDAKPLINVSCWIKGCNRKAIVGMGGFSVCMKHHDAYADDVKEVRELEQGGRDVRKDR